MTEKTCKCRRKMYGRPFSGSSSSYTGYLTDTTAPNGSLKKTMFKTYKGQQFITYNLEVENTPGWVLRNQLSDMMYVYRRPVG